LSINRPCPEAVQAPIVTVASPVDLRPQSTVNHKAAIGEVAISALAPSHVARLSLEQCREALPPAFEIKDHELERLRDELYSLAEIALDAAHSRCLRSR
jgi:hypothetical protein